MFKILGKLYNFFLDFGINPINFWINIKKVLQFIQKFDMIKYERSMCAGAYYTLVCDAV